MADRIFKGRLLTTGAIHDENLRAFPEASEDFSKPHKGGLNPYQMVYTILKDIERATVVPGETDPPIREINGSIWVSGEEAWIKIDPNGDFEIGISGA